MTNPTRAHREVDLDPARVASVRAATLRGSVGPLSAAVYLLGTWGEPHRPLMAAVVVVLLAHVALIWWLTPGILRRGHDVAQIVAILVHIAGIGVLMLLDGGVAGPLDAVAIFSMLFFAATLPVRMLLIVCAATFVGYWTVALLGDPGPPGYAVTITLGTGGVAFLCHRYAMALVSLRLRLADVSRTDPLTGCLNRRGFDERLEQELAQAARVGSPVTLLVVDLDHFKDVNDTYGHLTGDELLSWVGRTLRTGVHAHDVVGRLGGDEFAVVLSGVDGSAAGGVVDRLRTALGDGAPGSFGCAAYPADGTTGDDLRRVADRRLYEDKVRRVRQVPSREAVERARTGGTRPRPARVRRDERRRRTIREFGILAAACHAIGLNYVALLAGGRPHRPEMAALLTVGVVCGLLTVALAGRISRARAAGALMMALAVPEFAAAAAAAALDGGVLSPMALGLLAPLPLVAFGSPVRQAAPVVGAVLATYVLLGIGLGGVSAWYVGMFTGGSLGLAVICSLMGRSAARRRKLLTHLSRVDALTDCLNRRGFEEQFTAELSHADRTGRPLSLLVLDLDGFKTVNDTAGHAAGDALLAWVGATLHTELHPHDLIGRLGGDEFVVLLTGPDDEPRAVADRLTAALAPRTAVTIGTAVLGRDGTDFDSLYAHADAELYAGKRHRTSGELPAPPAPRGARQDVR